MHKQVFLKIGWNLQKIPEIIDNTADPVSSIENYKKSTTTFKNKSNNCLRIKPKSERRPKVWTENRSMASIFWRKVDLDAAAWKTWLLNWAVRLIASFFIGGAWTAKHLLVCYISKDLVADKGLNAGQIVRNWDSTSKGVVNHFCHSRWKTQRHCWSLEGGWKPMWVEMKLQTHIPLSAKEPLSITSRNFIDGLLFYWKI